MNKGHVHFSGNLLLCYSLVIGALGCDRSENTRMPLALDDPTLPGFRDAALSRAVGEMLAMSESLDASSLDRLQALTATGVGIKDLTGIEQLSALEVLDVSRNNIASIDSLEGLDKLVFLDVSANRISNIKKLAALRRLRILNLDQNRVVDISPIVALDSLRTLSVQANPLSETSRFYVDALASNGVQVIFDEESGEAAAGDPRVLVHAGGDLVVVSLSGQLENLTGTADVVELGGTWAPDGKQLAYYSWVQSEGSVALRGDLFVIDLETGERRNLTASRDLSERLPSWDPSGSNIAFISSELGGATNVHVLDLSTSRSYQVTGYQSQRLLERPTWSPDGARLAFEEDGRAYVVEARANASPQLVHEAGWLAWYPWSLDGQWLLVWTREGIGKVRSDGSSFVQLTDSVKDSWPSWLPGGKGIGFVSHRSGNRDIYVADSESEGLSVTNVTMNDASERWPSWSVDGRWIAFYAGLQVWAVPAGGGGVVLLADRSIDLDDLMEPPQWAPSGN